MIEAQHLAKRFKKFDAVKDVTFLAKRGEVFGFLGTNGAGKTTTMSILCGEQLPTHGRGVINGFDVVDNSLDAQRNLGYCPQFDALLDLLSAEEHLYLYAGLRGVSSLVINRVVVLGVLALLYWWLWERLRRTEKWIS